MFAKWGKNVCLEVRNSSTCSFSSSLLIPHALPDMCRWLGIGPLLLSSRGLDLGEVAPKAFVVVGARNEKEPLIVLRCLALLCACFAVLFLLSRVGAKILGFCSFCVSAVSSFTRSLLSSCALPFVGEKKLWIYFFIFLTLHGQRLWPHLKYEVVVAVSRARASGDKPGCKKACMW